MGKRKGGGQGGTSKRIKAFTTLEPGWRGIFVTCARRKELGTRAELVPLIEEYLGETASAAAKSGDIEDEIAAEVAALGEKKAVEGHLIGCECVIFVRIKGDASPVSIVEQMCRDAAQGDQRTRYAQKLTPVEGLVHASLENLSQFEPVIRAGFERPGLKFAIRAAVRNSQMNKEDVIKAVAKLVGQEHKVDLKQYDRLVLVECFKSSIGLSVVGGSYDEYERYNLQQIAKANVESELAQGGDSAATAKEESSEADKDATVAANDDTANQTSTN